MSEPMPGPYLITVEEAGEVCQAVLALDDDNKDTGWSVRIEGDDEPLEPRYSRHLHMTSRQPEVIEILTWLGFACSLVRDVIPVRRQRGRRALPAELRRVSRGVAMMPGAWTYVETLANRWAIPTGQVIEKILAEHRATH